MYYRNFKGEELSALGLGTMRMPTAPDGSIDEARRQEMVDYAMANGINDFDTAFTYHGGQPERALATALSK